MNGHELAFYNPNIFGNANVWKHRENTHKPAIHWSLPFSSLLSGPGNEWPISHAVSTHSSEPACVWTGVWVHIGICVCLCGCGLAFPARLQNKEPLNTLAQGAFHQCAHYLCKCFSLKLSVLSGLPICLSVHSKLAHQVKRLKPA